MASKCVDKIASRDSGCLQWHCREARNPSRDLLQDLRERGEERGAVVRDGLGVHDVREGVLEPELVLLEEPKSSERNFA